MSEKIPIYQQVSIRFPQKHDICLSMPLNGRSSVASDSSRQSTPKGAYHLFLGNTSATLILALNAIVISRLLGPSNYGLYALALVIPSYAYLFVHFGLTTASTRFAARYTSERQVTKAISFIYSMICFQILLSLIALLLVFPFSDFVATSILNRPALEGDMIPLAMLSLVGQTVMNVGVGGYTGLGRFNRAALLMVIQSVTRLAVSISLVLLGFSFIGAVAGYTSGFLSAGIIALIMIVLMNKQVVTKDFFLDLSTALRYSIPVYFSSLANGVVAPLLTTLLAVVVTNTEIGGYSVVLNISSIMLIFSYPITMSLLPLFSKTTNKRDLAEIFGTTVRYSGFFIVPVVTFVMLFSTPLVTIIFGHPYSFAGNYLLFYSTYYLLGGIGSTAVSGFLNGTGRTRQTLLANGTGFIVTIVAALPLITIFRVYGAIVSFILGNSLSLGIGTLMVKRHLQERLGLFAVWRTYVASFVAGVVSYIAMFLPGGPLVVTVIGGTIFLIAIIPSMVIFGALKESDVINIQSYFKDVKSLSPFVRLAVKFYKLFAR